MAEDNCIGAGSYEYWEPRYKCINVACYAETHCEHFVKPEFCTETDDEGLWCKSERKDIKYADKEDDYEIMDDIKLLKKVFE